MIPLYEIELNSKGVKRRLGFCFLSETEAYDWLKKHPIDANESYEIVPYQGYSVDKGEEDI